MEGAAALNTYDTLEQLIARKKNRQPSATQKVRPIGLEKAIWEDKPDADGNVNSAATKQMLYNTICKDLKSPDLQALRLISLADKMSELRNGQTVALNIVETNPIQRVTDFQVRFRERRLGFQTTQWVNLNVDAFAGEAQSNYPQRTNTLGFLGNQLNIRLIGQELAAQSPIQPVDVVQQEIEFEVTRIRRDMNKYFLYNGEVAAEVGATPPQPGGFINRSTVYNVTLAAASDLTNALIQSAVDSIANAASPEGLGYNVELVCLCTSAQIPKIRDLMISRYPGTNANTFLDEQSMLRARFAETGIAPNQMMSYQPNPGLPILFIFDPLLPANTIIFFEPNQPQLGKFKINGQYGPWAIERPTAALTTLLYVFDGFTTIDNLRESRYVLNNVN